MKNILEKIEEVKEAMEDGSYITLTDGQEALGGTLDAQTRLLEAIDSLLEEREETVRNITAIKRVLALTTQNGHDYQHIPTFEPDRQKESFSDQFVWKQAQVALQKARRPLGLGELADEIKALGGNPGKHPAATVQNAIKRYLDTTFTREKKEGRYRYGLVEWHVDDENEQLKPEG
jgi:hypothetical protein